MSYFRPNKSWEATGEAHHMEGGKLTAISYTSTDCRRFVQVTVKMAVTEYTRDATGKITSTHEVGPVGDCGRGYHVQPCQDREGWAETGLSWMAGRMVERPIPGSFSLMYIRECIVQGAINDGVIKDPEAWADRATLGREEYNAAIEAEKAEELNAYNATTWSIADITDALNPNA